MFGSSLAQDPIEWTAHGQQTCDAGEVCQETLLLIDVGAWAEHKGCTPAPCPVHPCLRRCALDFLPSFLEIFTHLLLPLHLKAKATIVLTSWAW
jgi:hypothetical protein